MSTLNPAPAVRRDPPWWLVVLTIPLVGLSLLMALFAGLGGVSWIDSVTASRQVTHTAPFPSGGTVAITAKGASVIIEAGPDGRVSVEVWMEVRTPTTSLAQARL